MRKKVVEGNCLLCNEEIEPCAGNPGRWGVLLSIPDGTGVRKPFHYECVSPLLATALDMEAKEQ